MLTVNKLIFILNFLIYETFLQFYQHEVGYEWHLILITLLSYYNQQLVVSIAKSSSVSFRARSGNV